MSNVIKLEIPATPSIMLAFAEALKKSAEAVTAEGTPIPEGGTVVTKTCEPVEIPTTTETLEAVAPPTETPVAPPAAPPEGTAASIFGSNPVTAPAGAPPVAPPTETPAIPPVTGVELDSAGLPWDGRIHASSKAKLAKDGTWKKIRKVDPELVAKVEAELRAAMAVPEPATTAAPVTPPVTTQTTTTTPLTFADFMTKVTGAGIDPQTVAAAVKQVGLDATPVLGARPDLIPAVLAILFPEA